MARSRGACRPILPNLPCELPPHLQAHSFLKIAFAQFELASGERPIGGVSPHGPNFALRRGAIGRDRFDERIGPAPGDTRSLPLGDETEFLRRIRGAAATSSTCRPRGCATTSNPISSARPVAVRPKLPCRSRQRAPGPRSLLEASRRRPEVPVAHAGRNAGGVLARVVSRAPLWPIRSRVTPSLRARADLPVPPGRASRRGARLMPTHVFVPDPRCRTGAGRVGGLQPCRHCWSGGARLSRDRLWPATAAGAGNRRRRMAPALADACAQTGHMAVQLRATSLHIHREMRQLGPRRWDVVLSGLLPALWSTRRALARGPPGLCPAESARLPRGLDLRWCVAAEPLGCLDLWPAAALGLGAR